MKMTSCAIKFCKNYSTKKDDSKKITFHLCDDIQDQTQVRGVFPASHCIYGVPLTINASFHLLLLLLKRASNLCPEASNVVVEGYLELTRGQGIEIYWRDNFICPTEEQYRKMINKKTGSFFIVIYRLLQLFSENKTDYSTLVSTLGSYFQTLDDYYALKHKEGLEGWPEEEDKKVYYDIKFCEDITEGKFSLPVIHAMQTEYGEQIMNILRQRTRDLNLKKYFVSLLEKAGSLQYTRNVLAEFDRELRAETARFGGNPEMDALLDQHLNWQ